MNNAEAELDAFLANIPQPQTYDDLKQELAAEQSGMSRQEIARKLASTSDAVFDPETAEKPKHNWVDRGEVMSCEGAGHPNHRSFKAKHRSM